MAKTKPRQSILLLALALLLPAAAMAAGSERPDFSGTWELNEELSENPREKMMEARGGRGGGELGR